MCGVDDSIDEDGGHIDDGRVRLEAPHGPMLDGSPDEVAALIERDARGSCGCGWDDHTEALVTEIEQARDLADADADDQRDMLRDALTENGKLRHRVASLESDLRAERRTVERMESSIARLMREAVAKQLEYDRLCAMFADIDREVGP